MAHDHASTSMIQSDAAPRGIAWLVAALTLVLALLGSIGGCTETPIDGSSADTTLRIQTKDTTVISEQRLSRDTVIESDRIVVIDTVFREIIVRDTVRVFDTVVVRSTHERLQVREARIILWNFKKQPQGFDTVDVAFQPSVFQVTTGSPEWRIRFEVRFQLARLLTEERFGKHGLSELLINIPDAPFRPGSLQLRDNPDFGMGAKLIWNDRVMRTGTEPGNKNEGRLDVGAPNERERTFSAVFTGGFYFSFGAPPIGIRVLFKMTY
jgi:hypothetical protein